MEVVSNKKIKLFNKFFQEFLDSYLAAAKEEPRTFKIKKSIVVSTFLEETTSVIESFLACDADCLKKISILKDAKINYNSVNLKWEHLHNLLWISQPNVSEEHLKMSKKGLELSKKKLDSPLAKNTLLGNLIQEMSGDIQNSLEGIDLSKVNPMELLSTLTKPGGSKIVGGIDFSSIIEKSTASLKAKIDNKTVNIEELKETASDISSKLNCLDLD